MEYSRNLILRSCFYCLVIAVLWFPVDSQVESEESGKISHTLHVSEMKSITHFLPSMVQNTLYTSAQFLHSQITPAKTKAATTFAHMGTIETPALAAPATISTITKTTARFTDDTPSSTKAHSQIESTEMLPLSPSPIISTKTATGSTYIKKSSTKTHPRTESINKTSSPATATIPTKHNPGSECIGNPDLKPVILASSLSALLFVIVFVFAACVVIRHRMSKTREFTLNHIALYENEHTSTDSTKDGASSEQNHDTDDDDTKGSSQSTFY